MPMTDAATLTMALAGYELKAREIETRMSELRRALGIHAAVATTVTATRHLSQQARKRIAAAQRKRWAEWHRQHQAS